MEPMLRVKISFIAEAGDRRWRAIKHLQSGEEIRGSGRRGIDVCSEPESTRLIILECVMTIRSFGGVCVRAGSNALLWGVVGLSQGFGYFRSGQQRAEFGGRLVCWRRANRAGAYEESCSKER